MKIKDDVEFVKKEISLHGIIDDTELKNRLCRCGEQIVSRHQSFCFSFCEFEDGSAFWFPNSCIEEARKK